MTRSDGQQQVLRALGHHILILRLQGFIFFGTADKLLHQIEMRLMEEKEPAVRFLLLDFRRVTGLDSTAVLSLRKLKQVADQHAVTLLVTEPTPTLRQQLMRGKLSEADGVKYFPDMDQGIAWCEDQLLARRSVAVTPPSLQEQLARLLPDDEDLRALIGHLQRQEVRAGTILMAQGDPPDHLYFIESGQVTAQTAVAGRPPRRLETMGAGRVVGELGFYLGQARTASVVVDKPGVVYLLTRAKLAQMEQSHPQAAAALHRLMVNLLADRVTHLVNTVNALEQ